MQVEPEQAEMMFSSGSDLLTKSAPQWKGSVMMHSLTPGKANF